MPGTLAVAFNCVALRGVPYVIAAGVCPRDGGRELANGVVDAARSTVEVFIPGISRSDRVRTCGPSTSAAYAKRTRTIDVTGTPRSSVVAYAHEASRAGRRLRGAGRGAATEGSGGWCACHHNRWRGFQHGQNFHVGGR